MLISFDHLSAIGNVLVDSGITQMVFVLCTELLMWKIFCSIQTSNFMSCHVMLYQKNYVNMNGGVHVVCTQT